MAIRDVLMIGNPKLREESLEIVDYGLELKEIVKDLEDTLDYLQRIKSIGRALAAPQIGYMKRVILYNSSNLRLLMINPVITQKSNELFEVWDSCFSFDVQFFVNIKRHKRIMVQFFDENCRLHERSYEDDLSELVQHETDHLDGILATDHLCDHEKIVMRSEWERRYR